MTPIRYRERVINIALDELGRSNGSRYEPLSPRNSVLWCGCFVIWVLKKAELLPAHCSPVVTTDVICRLPRCVILEPGDIVREPLTEHMAFYKEAEWPHTVVTIGGSMGSGKVSQRKTQIRDMQCYSISGLIREKGE